MTPSELAPEDTDVQRFEYLSRFRRAQWLPRDVAVGVALALLLAGSVYATTRGVFAQLPYSVLIVMGAVQEFGVLLAIPLWLLRKRSNSLHDQSRPAVILVKEVLVAIPATLGVLLCMGIVAYSARFVLVHLDRPVESAMDFWGRMPKPGLAPLIFLAVVIAPVVEEIFFRGFLYNALRSIVPAWMALISQALLFGLGHLYEPLGVPTTFVAGLLLAVIYERRRTLLAPILVHGMWNAIVMVVIVGTIFANAKAPMIGITFVPEAKELVVVDKVLPGSPAEKAGLQPGDVIERYNGTDVTDSKQLLQLIRKGKVGDEVTLEILRGERRMQKKVTLRSREEVE